MGERAKGKTMTLLNHITTLILFAVIIGVLILVPISKTSNGEPSIFGYQFKVVLSGSMEPGIKTGSIIMVKLGEDMSALNKNDVITFHAENTNLVTHRIIEVINSDGNVLYRTQGDSNDGPDRDPVQSENVVAEYTGLTVPYVGYVVVFLQSNNGALLIILSGILLLFYSFYGIWRAFVNTEVINEGKDVGDEGANKTTPP